MTENYTITTEVGKKTWISFSLAFRERLNQIPQRRHYEISRHWRLLD